MENGEDNFSAYKSASPEPVRFQCSGFPKIYSPRIIEYIYFCSHCVVLSSLAAKDAGRALGTREGVYVDHTGRTRKGTWRCQPAASALAPKQAGAEVLVPYSQDSAIQARGYRRLAEDAANGASGPVAGSEQRQRRRATHMRAKSESLPGGNREQLRRFIAKRTLEISTIRELRASAFSLQIGEKTP